MSKTTTSTRTAAPAVCSLLLLLLLLLAAATDAFVAITPPPSTYISTRKIQSPSTLRYGSGNNNDDSSFDWPVLQARLDEMRLKICEFENFHQPPNANLDAYDFVTQLLHGLWDDSNPMPDAGYRRLLRSSTPSWQEKLYQSVGAPYPAANIDVVASALHDAMARPDNQFALLLEETHEQHQTTRTASSRSRRSRHDNHNRDDAGEEKEEVAYRISFPHEALDYADGTCWLECQLRSAANNGDDDEDDKLLVSTGWELRRRASDNAWLVERIDWQDFREAFRPGIGRQEWTRVCG
jgi:hypothetical protein